jgi:predicted dehydrogenase
MATQIVLVGLEGHQSVMLRALPSLPEVSLAAVVHPNAEAVVRLRRSQPGLEDTRHFTDLETLLTELRPDVAVLCEPNGDRARDVIVCARAGVHILAEKPLATSLADLEASRAAVQAAGITLSMLLTMRYEPIYVALREAIGQGAIGEPLLATAQKSYRRGDRPAWQRTYASYGGTIPFIGIHALDLIRWSTGREFTRCAALQHNAGLPGAGAMEETASVLLQLDNGGSATARLDYLRPAAAPTHGDDRLRVAGPEGVIEAAGERLTLVTQDQSPRELEIPPTDGQFADFLAATRGERTCRVPAEDAFRMTEIVLRARQAAETGQWVECR